MASYNKVILVGRLTSAPELRRTQGGTAVTSFRLAVDRQTQDKQTDFLDIVAWRDSAEFAARNFTKGQEILVEGKIQTRSYEDREGNKRTAVEVVVDRFSFMGSKKKEQDNEQNNAGGFTPIDEDDDDELPF